MKKALLFLLSILMFYTGRAQFDFPNDPEFNSWPLYKRISKKFHLEKETDFELRVWPTSFIAGRFDLFILSHKNNKWTARLFRNVLSRNEILEDSLKGAGLDSLWNKLAANNILNIPEAKKLKDSTGKEARVAIHDGTSYEFELVTPKNKRSYFYHCPYSHSLEYPYIKEFTQVVNIINLIAIYCKINDEEYLCKQARIP